MTAPDPKATKSRRRPSPAVWMSVLAAGFVLIGGVALGASVAARYGDEIASMTGLASGPASPHGDWALAQHAPVGAVRWSFSGDRWVERPSPAPDMQEFGDSAYGCSVLLQSDTLHGISLPLPDTLTSPRVIDGTVKGLQKSGATVSRTEPTRHAWVAAAGGKVELDGVTVEFTPRGGNRLWTGYIFARVFNTTDELVNFMIECPKDTFDAHPSLLADALSAASLTDG